MAKEERRKVDGFRALVDEENRLAEELEKMQDKQFVSYIAVFCSFLICCRFDVLILRLEFFYGFVARLLKNEVR